MTIDFEVGLTFLMLAIICFNTITGSFQPGFCPNNVGCRVALTFDQSGGRSVTLNGPDIRVLFNGTLGRNIWLVRTFIFMREIFL